MRFTCDSCGKRFASVDEPLPGRVYRIRCRRCGHLLSVQAPVPWEEPAADLFLDVQVVSEDAAEARAAVDAALRRESIAAGLPAPQLPAEGTEEVPIDLALSDEYPLIRKRRRRRVTRLALALSGVGAATVAVLAFLLARGPGQAPSSPPDPARPAPTSREPGAVPAPSGPRDAPVPGPAPVPASPPPAERAGRAGAEGGEAPAGRTPAAPARSRPPRAAVAFEHDAEPRAPPPAAPVPERVDPDLAAALLAKSDVAVRAVPPDLTELQAILDGRRGALAACFDGAAGTAGAAAWAGRSPQLVVKVDPTGRATGRLDDAALEPTEIASCLRRTVTRTGFPAFAGEPVELRVPVGIP